MAADPDDFELNLSDDNTDALFDTPGKPKTLGKDSNDASADATASIPSRPRSLSRQSDGETREAALQRELESVRGVNKVVEGVIESLEKARDNMGVGHPAKQICIWTMTALLTS